MDETRTINVGELLKNSQEIYSLTGPYILLKDSSMLGGFRNLIEAVNLLAEFGWEAVGIANDGSGGMFAMMHNTQYKRKNEGTS